MFGFNGDFRQRPIQSMRGASKNEMKETLLKRTQEERQKREDNRLRIASARRIQAQFRGFHARKILWNELRDQFDARIKGKNSTLDIASLHWCISKLCLFFDVEIDGQRLIFICQELIKQRDAYLNVCGQDYTPVLYQLRLTLNIVIRYLDSIASSSATIAIPMRMLEIFLSSNTYSNVVWSEAMDGDKTVNYLLSNVVRNGYFDCLRNLLNNRVPSSLDKTSVPPTPVAESIFDLIMKPVSFAVSYSKDMELRQDMLRQVTKTFLCQQYTEQIGMFLLPAMAYGKYPFPFVELVQTLILGVSSKSGKKNESKTDLSTTRLNGFSGLKTKEGDTPWLLASVLTLANKDLENLSPEYCATYLRLLQRLLLQLPASKHFSTVMSEQSDSGEEDEDMDDEPGVTNLHDLHSECLRLIDSPAHLKCLYTCLTHLSPSTFIESLASISHCLLAHQKLAMHKIRLLYVLAFNPQFMRNLWNQCVSLSVKSVTGSHTSLISMLANGVPISRENISRIIPLLTTFCCLFDHSLLTLDDADFYGQNDASKSSMPFSIDEMKDMCATLRDTCVGIIELAHPDSRVAIGNDYVQALQLSDGKYTKDDQMSTTHQWAYLFKAVSTLVRQLHNRDSRRPFCPFTHWLTSKISIRTDRPAQIYELQNGIFTRRDFGSLASLTKMNADMEGPPLANRDVRNLVILTELPFVVSFLDRVKILQSLLAVDKRDHQGDLQGFGMGPSININIRRNFLYEDAFEKLSAENEPNLKKKIRIQLLNAAGLDEAGIDGGGVFREFLSELMKTGFDPNRGFFCYTTDRLLYPNPEACLLVDNFLNHYYFLGRILGKALMENLMVEIPFASFFLSKILSPSNVSLDIHHLQSLDPLLYKNLLYLKHYDGDVTDLGLDFTVVNSQFGETKVVDLKPNGANIPVDNTNRIEYIHLMADYRINKQIRQHCNAFRTGMNDVIQVEWLQMFNSGELQVLISGASVPIDLEDLRRNTAYSGEFSNIHPVIEMFWDVLNDFTDIQRRQLLKFVTSCSRPPLLGFKDLYPAFCIHSAGPEDRLPTASTCMNLLKLPMFKDRENLKNKLLYAIESGAGFELS